MSVDALRAPRDPAHAEPLLHIENLCVTFETGRGRVRAVEGLTLDVGRGEAVAIVGESGSGKSVSMKAVLGLLKHDPAVSISGVLQFDGQDLLAVPDRQYREMRGAQIALISQDALSGLNPTLTIGYQVAEPLIVHRRWSRRRAMARARELLDLVGIPAAGERLADFPHQLSGGMRQRALIAVSLALEPDLLIADEPTTALDVTIQDQILRLLDDLRRRLDMTLVLITHDMGVVARVADAVVVMYSGSAVESGRAREVFKSPRHPYTEALLQAVPRSDRLGERLHAIRGNPPNPAAPPSGCRFHPRCDYARTECAGVPTPLVLSAPGHATACPFWRENHAAADD